MRFLCLTASSNTNFKVGQKKNDIKYAISLHSCYWELSFLPIFLNHRKSWQKPISISTGSWGESENTKMWGFLWVFLKKQTFFKNINCNLIFDDFFVFFKDFWYPKNIENTKIYKIYVYIFFFQNSTPKSPLFGIFTFPQLPADLEINFVTDSLWFRNIGKKDNSLLLNRYSGHQNFNFVLHFLYIF